MISTEQLYQVLEQRFGFTHFRPGQLEALKQLAAGHHTLAVLPTGAGKTLIYELYGTVTSQLVLIVSPLISLMADQVTTLNVQGEKRAAALTSLMTYAEKNWVLRHLGQYRFLFVSPEMLSQDQVLAAFQAAKVGLLVVDEAHCISTWGPDFRPEYLLLGQIRHQLNDPLTLMTTATATPQVRADVKQKLQLPQAVEIIQPVDRPNIFLDVESFQTRADKDDRLVELVAGLKKPGVIYFSSKKKANEMAALLNAKTASRVAAYHADLDPETRFKVQQQFMQNQLDVICATSAFGMGIDKDNVRFVIHYHLPSDVEAYWQEIGRAGRDGEQSVAILLYQPGDEQIARFLSEATVPQENEIHYYFRQDAPQMAGDVKANLIWFYKQHRYREEQVQASFAKRRQQRLNALQKMLSYVRTSGCKRQYIQRYFDQFPGGSKAPKHCCSIDEPGFNLSELGLLAAKSEPAGEQKELEATAWQSILLQLFNDAGHASSTT
ncbi:ATP-dependent DNA helicase RecQ [Secundilactobacillus pentosiphilus]|uniref:ATP-dependent DNA helicase RecQ n=1 Tax=Secundilactobacillus pentosiphilus TaxID=1714682 RepID=A0A1Z5IMN5_9LACO|nr:RecQ family ATP-dependent DNA helicase [Secundilactobacillus pentosiphilus]GAX02898.1 ATP-dependent DNA helicase RecQ [Secundilactobacillus pentosiphilus]